MLIGVASVQSKTEIASIGSSGAGIALSIAAPALIKAGIITAAAVPLIGAGIAAVSVLAGILIKNSGCGQTCVVTSQWANEAAELLQRNSDEYFALPAPRSRANQQIALQTFDSVWARLVELYSNPAVGDAGKTGIADRQAGACKWKQNQTGGHPGEPAIGECWNWFNGYRDPIANDPTTETSASAAALAPLTDATGLDAPELFLAGALLIGLFL